jgi:4-diphosphocytidyl-2-C-methyl-D-erythritol kinase
MIILRELAPAKVNLYLHVLGRRADGYHMLDSLVCFADIADKLEVIPSGDITLAIEGPFAPKLSLENNSVLKAAVALQKHAGVKTGAALTLHKHLPLTAGIGGGSADAAAALRLLMRFWGIRLGQAYLADIALKLGADVPACLRSAPLYMGGIGELLETGPSFEGLYLVLANPGVELKTPEVFAHFEGPFSGAARHPQAFASAEACVDFLRRNRNDLESPAKELLPDITKVLEALLQTKGCMLARMSGSGATCFGLFADAHAAKQAALALSTKYPAITATAIPSLSSS